MNVSYEYRVKVVNKNDRNRKSEVIKKMRGGKFPLIFETLIIYLFS